MEAITFPQFQDASVYISLFRDIDNSGDIKKRIISTSISGTDEDKENLNFAFIDASLVTSRLHIRTAIYQALVASFGGQGLRTKTVHSEILYYLNPTHNITEAIRRYGIAEGAKNVLVVRIDSSGLTLKEVESRIHSVVQGKLVSLDELRDVTDWKLVKKYHKLTSEPAIKKLESDVGEERKVIDNIVVSSVAMKTVMG